MRHIPDELAWQAHARCIEGDADTFFTESRYPEAKTICGHCTVKTECLEYAKTQCIDYGVWGGTTPDERRPPAQGSRRRVMIDHGTAAGYRMHLRRDGKPCDDCKAAKAEYQSEISRRGKPGSPT